MGILQSVKTQSRDTAEAVHLYPAKLNEYLHQLIYFNKDGTPSSIPNQIVTWQDDFTRIETNPTFVDKEDRTKKFGVTMGAVNVLQNISASKIEADKPFENPDFLTPSSTSPFALKMFNQHDGNWLDKLIKQDSLFKVTTHEDSRYKTKGVIREQEIRSHIEEHVLYNKSSENTLMRKHDHCALIQVSDHSFTSFKNFGTSLLRMYAVPQIWEFAEKNYLQVAVEDKPQNFSQKMLTNQVRHGPEHFGNLLYHASPENFALIIENNPLSFTAAMTSGEQKSIIGTAVSKTMQLGGSLHIMLHLVESASTNWHTVLFAPIFAEAAGLQKAPEKLALPTTKLIIEALNASWSELRDVAIPALQQVDRFDSHALLSFLENEVPLGCILYDTFLKNGKSDQYYHGLAHVLVCATKSCRNNYMANTFRMLDQKQYLERVNHGARRFFNDEALASNCEGFGEGHFNLIASQICRENNNNFKKAKDQILQHFFNDMDGELSNFKKRVLPCDIAKGCASVDRIDNIISIATKLLTEIIIRIVQAPQSDWPTPHPEMKGRQHSDKSTCPWIVPTFGNKAKSTDATKTKPTIASISVEGDNSKPMLPITFVTMEKDAVKDDIQIGTTEVPTTTPMLVALDEVVRGSKRPIEDTAQDTQHSPKASKNSEDFVDSATFMLPAAHESSASLQPEQRTATLNTIEKKARNRNESKSLGGKDAHTEEREDKIKSDQRYKLVLESRAWIFSLCLVS